MSEIARVTMTSKEAAKYLGIGYNKILELTQKNTIPHVRLGKTYYYTKEFLDKWLVDEQSKPSRDQEIAAMMDTEYPHLCKA
jgi:excisionase family DNA binding protein